MKKKIKRTVILLMTLVAFNSFTGCSEADEETDCQGCIDAQIYLCEALGRTNGNLSQAQNAVDKVKKACGSLGDKKVRAVYDNWGDSSLECNKRGYTCK